MNEPPLAPPPPNAHPGALPSPPAGAAEPSPLAAPPAPPAPHDDGLPSPFGPPRPAPLLAHLAAPSPLPTATAHLAGTHGGPGGPGGISGGGSGTGAGSGEKVPPSASRKLLQRVATVGGLALLLLIPLQLIRSTIAERTAYRAEAVQRVVANTTAAQQLIGPLLVMPWSDVVELSLPDGAGGLSRHQRRTTGHVLRAPSKLTVSGQLVPNLLRVGLYEVSVYEWRAHLQASFASDAPLPQPAEGTRTWGQPYLVFGIADVRGLVGSPQLKVDGAARPLVAGTRALVGKLAGVHALLPEVPASGAPVAEVSLDFALKGTHSLEVVPVGDDTRVELTSSWPHPKFDGYSPKSEVSDAGFRAVWEISSLASNVRGALLGDSESRKSETGDPAQVDDVAASRISSADALAVSLVDPVDIYTETDRASKYGILFVLLTFVGFVAFELAKRLPIHPMQYLLVGLALAVFFLLLLSLSEHLAFWRAYLVSAGACIGLQLAYLSGVLKSWLRASGFAVMLTALYGVLYCLLASEDSALLMGSLLLFSVLAVIMWATRKVDWYELGAQLR